MRVEPQESRGSDVRHERLVRQQPAGTQPSLPRAAGRQRHGARLGWHAHARRGVQRWWHTRARMRREAVHILVSQTATGASETCCEERRDSHLCSEAPLHTYNHSTARAPTGSRRCGSSKRRWHEVLCDALPLFVKTGLFTVLLFLERVEWL